MGLRSRSEWMRAIMLALGMSVVLAGCAGQAPSASSSAASTDQSSTGSVAATAASSDALSEGSQPAATGSNASDTVSMTFDFNAGTGYEWDYSADVEGVLTCVDRVTNELSEAETAGGLLQDAFTFRAESPGEVVLTFELKRFWEEGEEPAETQIYAYTVSDDLQVILNPYKSNFENEPVWL